MRTYKWHLEKHMGKVSLFIRMLTHRKRYEEFTNHNIEKLIEKYLLLEKRVASLERDTYGRRSDRK